MGVGLGHGEQLEARAGALAWREVRRGWMVWALQDSYNLAFISSEVGIR